jgi:hypothetical protein
MIAAARPAAASAGNASSRIAVYERARWKCRRLHVAADEMGIGEAAV